jgi:hypothetical protein
MEGLRDEKGCNGDESQLQRRHGCLRRSEE